MSVTFQNSADDLHEPLRVQMRELLNQQLVDSLDLGMQVKHAHWNVKGPQFISLHELYDDIAEELEQFGDDLAERAVELGGIAGGTLQIVSERSRLAAYPLTAVSGQQHNQALAAVIATVCSTCRAAIAIASNAGDADTADLFTEVSRGMDKILWKIEAHLQSAS